MHPSSQGLPQPGDVLAGRFRVERVLGVGGMGSVFAAEDMRFSRWVALKLMLPELLENPEFAGRFSREAKAAASLASRHVARVLEVGRLPEGAPFMVMELLRGRDLQRVLRERGPLPIPEAVGYLLEAGDAIAEAHRLGIVHRDLKPSNLFLAEQEGDRPIVKVLDFGISKSTKLDGANRQGDGATLTATDSALGSPHYMSPEQLRSAKKVDHRTDIWSLGSILHKLLTGHLAFESDSIGAHLAMIVADPPTPLRARRPDAPAELEQVVLRCLQKDLSLRYQNLGQLALALAPFAPLEARPLVERIVAQVGQKAARTPLPSLVPEPLGPPRATATVPLALGAALPLPTAPAAVRALAEAPAPAAIRASAPVLAPALAPPAMPASMPPPAPMPWPPQAEVPTGTGAGWAPGAAPPPRAGGMGALLGGSAAIILTAAAVALLILRPWATPAVAVPAAAPSTAAAAPAPVNAAPTITAAPSASAAPAEVRITVEVEPAEATLELDGAPVQGRSLRVPRADAVHKLVVRAPGYAAETREISAREDAALAIVLHRADAGVPGPMPGRKMKGPVETTL